MPQSVNEANNIDEIDSSKIDPSVKLDLEFILERNLKDIITLFAAYVDTLRSIIKEKGVSPDELQTYLISLPAFKENHKGKKLTLLANKEAELEKCDSIPKIFKFLSTKCSSFLDYEIFEDIMKFYKISKDQEHLNYSNHLHTYIQKHKISEFTKIIPFLKEKEGSKELTLKFDIEITCSLAKVTDLKKSIASILGLLPSALEIVDIEDGCVIVTHLISASVADAIFTPTAVFTSLQKDELRLAKVLWLKCNGHVFNFQQPSKSVLL